MNFEAFQDRVLPAKNKLFRFALRMLGDEEDAKDVIQEVFIRVWNGREQMDQIQNMEAWCMRITKNLSLDRLRSQQRRGTQSLDNSFDLQQADPTPDQKTEIGESMQNVSQFIAALPEKQRQVIHLRDVEGYTYNEISDISEVGFKQDDWKKLVKDYKSESYEEVMTSRYQGKNFDVYLKEKDGKTKGMVVLVNDPVFIFGTP